jgi:Hemolysin-type calcium-binding repeat (2 copies).
LYYQGQALTYHLDGNVLTAETSANAVGFTLTINPDYQTYTFNSNGVISNGTETTATESDVINPGIAPFVVLTDLGTTSQDAIITGTDSINTSQTIGIGNQNITAGEGIRFDLVNNAVFKPYGGPSTYDRFTYSDHNLTTRFSQNVAWTDNPADTANIIVYAIVADNDGAGDLQASDLYNDSSGGDTYIGLSAANVVVYDGENPTPLIQGTDYFVTDNGDSVTISGLMQGWIFEIITDDTHPFNAVQIEGAADTDAFKLGYFSYGENTPGDPIELNYDIIGTDGDGDTITGNIDVTLYPDPVTYMGTSGGETIDANLVAPGVTDNVLLADGGDDAVFGRLGNDVLDGNQGNDHLYGNEGDDKLYGGSGNDQLDGGDGADLLSGGSGDDLLDGGSGADTLDGGIGNDTLTGGLGTDTFKAGEGHDTIMDYNQAENDVVDISHVLDSAEEDHSRLGVIENAGKAELVIYDNAAHDNAIGSVTFDTINFSTLTPGDELNSLLGQVDVDHTA